MMALDREALLCDLAETYGIYDMRALPVSTLAVLASGLRENSRIKMKMAGAPARQETILLSAAVDRLSFLCWAKTEDGRRNRNRPASMVQALMERGSGKQQKAAGFDSPEEFRNAWNAIAGRDRHGN